jgi:2-keto-4-pentenoate hydratase/2-oxohepta-3-ene-1,7-dioic acid hydratase in catechol pathway
MKFVRFEDGEGTRLGILSREGSQVLDIAGIVGAHDTMVSLIETWTDEMLINLRAALDTPDAPWKDLANLRLLAPIGRPVHDILCVGVNYADHRAETKHDFASDARTVYFAKRASAILGPGEPIPARFDLDEQLDYEVELAVIIGKGGRDIPKEDVERYIFGYSIFNDLSSRALQKAHSQWFRGKSLDGYAAMGPCILHREALPFPMEVEVSSHVNGELRQSSNTRLMIADIPSIVSELSQGIMLEPGDIIATGTPAGVGIGFTPPRFLKRGDTVTLTIPQIGALENPVGYGKAGPS